VEEETGDRILHRSATANELRPEVGRRRERPGHRQAEDRHHYRPQEATLDTAVETLRESERTGWVRRRRVGRGFLVCARAGYHRCVFHAVWRKRSAGECMAVEWPFARTGSQGDACGAHRYGTRVLGRRWARVRPSAVDEPRASRPHGESSGRSLLRVAGQRRSGETEHDDR
jgi:hypothetical protein